MKPPKKAKTQQPTVPQLSHAEIKRKIEEGDVAPLLDQLRRADRKIVEMNLSNHPDAAKGEASATATTVLVMHPLIRDLDVAGRVRRGGTKGQKARFGDASSKLAKDQERWRWYLAEKQIRHKGGAKRSDTEILNKCPDKLKLSPRALSRLKAKYR